MAWRDTVDGIGTLQPSEFDSRRFGLSVARLSVGEGWPDVVDSKDALYESIRSRLDAASETLVVLRAPSSLARLATDAIPKSRFVIPAGTLMYWAADVETYTPRGLPSSLQAWTADADNVSIGDLDEISRAIGDSFRGYVSHYSHNPLLNQDLVAAGYQEWATRSVLSSGSGCVLAEGGAVVGVATVSDDIQDSVCEIELAGIVSSRQNRGLYRHLMDSVVLRAREKGINRVVISTQSHNIHVQRAWAAAGLKPVAAVETIHCMTGNDDGLRR